MASRSDSARSSSSSVRPTSGASRAATLTGSSIRNGWAKTVTESSDTASSTPLRSKIVPRRAGSSMSSICWLTARSDSAPDLTVPSQVARSAASDSRSRKSGEQQADAPLDEPRRREARPAPAGAGWRAALRGRHGLARRGGRRRGGGARRPGRWRPGSAAAGCGGSVAAGSVAPGSRGRVGTGSGAVSIGAGGDVGEVRGGDPLGGLARVAAAGAPSGSGPRRRRAARGRAARPTPGSARSRRAAPRRAGCGRSRA